MSSLKKLCALLGWGRLRRWTEFTAKVKTLEATAAVETTLEETLIEWPTEWTDRGAVRRFDDTRNYPAAAPGIIYVRQITELLGHHSPERVLKLPPAARPGRDDAAAGLAPARPVRLLLLHRGARAPDRRAHPLPRIATDPPGALRSIFDFVTVGARKMSLWERTF